MRSDFAARSWEECRSGSEVNKGAMYALNLKLSSRIVVPVRALHEIYILVLGKALRGSSLRGGNWGRKALKEYFFLSMCVPDLCCLLTAG